MIKIFARFSVLALGVGLVALLEVAPARAGDAIADFAASDTNKDGRIDRAEYDARMVEVFFFVDRNKDGKVTFEELEIIDQPAFKSADTNADGGITIDEFVMFRAMDFTNADRNRDAVLTADEVQAWAIPLR